MGHGRWDWIDPRGISTKAQRFFEAIGYTPHVRFNTSYGQEQLLFFDEQRGRQVDVWWARDVLVFHKIPPMEQFCAFTDAPIREFFETTDPTRAQFGSDRDEYLSQVEAWQKRFRQEVKARDLFLATLGHVGVDPRRTFWDRLYLRGSPHGEQYSDPRTAKLGFHRDTWSSSVYAQTNWWAPIYPISPGRTIAFCGEYWEKR